MESKNLKRGAAVVDILGAEGEHLPNISTIIVALRPGKKEECEDAKDVPKVLPESMLEELKILANKRRDVPYQSLDKVFPPDRIEPP